MGILDLPRVGTDRLFVTHNALGLPWLWEAGLGEASGPWRLGQALQKAAWGAGDPDVPDAPLVATPDLHLGAS